jgi:dynein heavy chain
MLHFEALQFHTRIYPNASWHYAAVLEQEDKFKMYYNELTFAIKEHHRVIGSIAPISLALLAPHLIDLEGAMGPGMTDLTWTSMNIDWYLTRIHSKLRAFEALVQKTNDMLHNRIDANVKEASRVVMVLLPSDQSTTLEDFVAGQNKLIKDKGSILAVGLCTSHVHSQIWFTSSFE